MVDELVEYGCHGILQEFVVVHRLEFSEAKGRWNGAPHDRGPLTGT